MPDSPDDAATVPGDEAWSHEFVETNGVRLHAVTAGPEDGDLAVLLHGFPEFWYSWKHQIPALAEAGYRVVAPDMRGYNRSEKPPGVDAYHVDELVSDVVGLVRAFDRESACVVGHDWGGLVAWYAAIQRPSVVDRLAVLNAPHPARYEEVATRSPRQLLKSWYVAYFQLPWLPEFGFRWNDYAILDDVFRESTVRPDAFSEADVERYRAALSRPGALTAAINYYRAMGRATLKRRLTGGELDGRVETPTLLVWGEQDFALDRSLTDGLERWVPDVRVDRLPDASHWVQMDAPERVTDAVLSHLGRGYAR
ncbi:alpha/beta fold hydrolase [Haloarcula marina]|uniref:alpha/beta fold hydrolase n=1 Tax=Haloarcula marina TaxID=2961574 RepID=UPI0020B7AC09|nr:alpha/beta hydrolase [Halomicroarcula marina]